LNVVQSPGLESNYRSVYINTGLIANCLMLDNTIEISAALNALAKEGYLPTIDELAALSPYQTRHIKRFGNYELDLSAIPAPVTDDLTFALEPPRETDTIEADHQNGMELAQEPASD